MMFPLDNKRKLSQHCHRRSPYRRFRLAMERLEDRLVLSHSPIIVDTFADVLDPLDGLTSLREAINSASNPGELSPDDFSTRIILQAGTYEISPTRMADDETDRGDFDISGPVPVIIEGAGKDRTMIDGRGMHRVFHVITWDASDPNPLGVLGDPDVSFQGLTVQNGSTDGVGGGIFVDNIGTP